MPDTGLILRGGRVIDPERGIDAVGDVSFARPGGGGARRGRGARRFRLIVVPGLIDMHTHVYWGGTSLGIRCRGAYARRMSGVTTAVDTGSCRTGQFRWGSGHHVIERSAKFGSLPYLHVSFAGIYAFSTGSVHGRRK